ncbi:unnamed protein product [Durusdinium trenchii]|uniref:Uncharacterized protein n=1 Tax=Durusdinium trenchii TaxID=1381693 RepID=A0ABP0RA50_9DINO
MIPCTQHRRVEPPPQRCSASGSAPPPRNRRAVSSTSARRIFCPPAKAEACEVDEFASSEAIDLEVLCERLLFAVLSRSYEIPRGALSREVSELLQRMLLNVQEGLEALRLLTCTWSFRLCWLPNNSTKSWLVAANAAKSWWHQWWQLLEILEKASDGMVSAGQGLFKSYGVPLNLVEIPKPSVNEIHVGSSVISAMSTQAETFYQAFLMSLDPIMGEVIPQVLEHRKRFDRQARGLKMYSPDFPAEVPHSQLWQFYPDSFAAVCVKQKGEGNQRRQASEGSALANAFDMAGLRMLHRTVLEALVEIDAAGEALSFQVLNLGAMDGRCSGGPSTDPANCLLLGHSELPALDREGQNRSRWGGILVEVDPPPQLFERFAGRDDLLVVPRPVFPENASEHPESLDLLKIDLDSFDCDVISSVLRVGPLASNPPKLLYIDFNPHIPPPFLYRTISRSQSRIIPFQGSSLQCFLEAAPGFQLLHVELFNAILVRRDLQRIFPELRKPWGSDPFKQWAHGYFCHPLARVLWHRERQIRWEAADPRLWADEAVPLAERGQSLLKTLGRVRDRVPSFEFSLTW